MHSKKISVATIVFISFLDLLGITLILPILAPLLFGQQGAVFTVDTSFDTRAITLGLLVAAYPAAQFFGAPLLGAFSDKIGRKPILLLAFFGTMTAHLLVAFGILKGLLWVLFLARILDGFTGGNVSVIQAITSDISKREDRSKNFGFVSMAFGLSFVLGPFIGGQLSDSTIVPWFNYATPFFFAAGLSCITIFATFLLLPETRDKKLQHQSQHAFHIFAGLRSLYRVLQTPVVRSLVGIMFLLSLGFSYFTFYYQIFLVDVLQYTPRDIGLFFGFVGLWIALTQGILNPFLSRRFSSDAIVPFSMIGLIIAFGLLLQIEQEVWLFILAPLIALSQGLTQPNILALISQSVNDTIQGEILGVNQSLTSLATALAPMTAGFFAAIYVGLPLVVAMILISLAWIIFMYIHPRSKITVE